MKGYRIRFLWKQMTNDRRVVTTTDNKYKKEMFVCFLCNGEEVLDISRRDGLVHVLPKLTVSSAECVWGRVSVSQVCVCVGGLV